MTKHVGRIFYSLVFSLIVLSVVILGSCFSIALYHIIKTASEIIPHGPVVIGVIFCYLFVVTIVGIYREETDLLDNFDNWRQRD